MSDDGVRTFRIDGAAARRSIFGRVPPTLVVTWLLAAVLALVLYSLFGGSKRGFLAMLVLAGLVAVATWERPGHRAPLWAFTHAVHAWCYRHSGLNVFTPGVRWLRPPPVGRVEPLDLAGTGLDRWFILHHQNPGERDYFTVTLRVSGVSSGLRVDQEWATAADQFSSFLAELARPESHIRSVQFLHRSVAHNMTPRWVWAMQQIQGGDRLAQGVESYEALLHLLAPYAQEHRSFVVLKIPRTEAFSRQAKKYAKGKNFGRIEPGWGKVVRDEAERARNMLLNAGMGDVQILGQRAVSALIRSLQVPTYPMDQHKGVDWSSCWLPYTDGRDSVAFDGWHTRVGVVPPAAYARKAQTPAWMIPFLTGVRPDPGNQDDIAPSPTNRTVIVTFDLVPQAIAAQVAREDRTADTVRLMKEQGKGQITTGSADVALSASARRALDLQDGSGHHGVVFGVVVVVTAPDDDAVDAACTRVAAAASDSGIKQIDWLNDFHGRGLFTLGMPFGRGPYRTRGTRQK